MTEQVEYIAQVAIMNTPTSHLQMIFSVYLDDYRRAIEEDDIIAEHEARDVLWDFFLEYFEKDND